MAVVFVVRGVAGDFNAVVIHRINRRPEVPQHRLKYLGESFQYGGIIGFKFSHRFNYTMKRSNTFIVAGLMLALFLTGCAGSPKAKTYAFRKSYTATVTALDQLAVAGKLTPAQAKQIQQLRPIADAAENTVLANPSGGAAFDAALNAAQAVLNQLIAVQSQAKGK